MSADGPPRPAAARPPDGLRHEALEVAGRAGLISVAATLLTAAQADGAVPALFAGPDEIEAVRSVLGADGRDLLGFDMSVDGRNPARLLPALQRLVAAHPSRRLACVIEPVPPGAAHERLLGEVAIHEAALHLPDFRAWRCELSCAYDTEALPEQAVAAVRAAHPAAPAAAEQALERARGEALPPRPPDTAELGVDRATLGAVRGFIAGRAAAAGLDPERVDDLVYAVNEAVTNSLCHGEGRARVGVWATPDAVVCEVRDRGWIRDPLAGRLVPDPARINGRGLWLINQLCDFVELRSSPRGTTVRMHVLTSRVCTEGDNRG